MALLDVQEISIVRGGKSIVNNMSFSLDGGEVLGLIGPNGAGKSTTLGGLLGFYPLQAGEIQLAGTTVTKDTPLPPEVKGRIAYIPEQPMYYADLTLMEHFEWKQRLWQTYKPTQPVADLEELIANFELEPHLKKFGHQCSKGTLQKLMIVSALMFPYDLLVIDEPFIGLDILAIRQLKQYIAKARDNGVAVLVSTHVLDAAEKMCSNFVLMSVGNVVASGTVEQLTEQSSEPAENLEDLFVNLVLQQRREAEYRS